MTQISNSASHPASVHDDSKEAILNDPNKKYPQPPFERQKQEWPGLATKMTPPPDHGEESYRGSGRLNGRKA